MLVFPITPHQRCRGPEDFWLAPPELDDLDPAATAVTETEW
jgi:hypothetical protein